MAILKKINFGNGAHNIAKTVLTAKEGGVMSVAAPTGVTNGDDENANYQYELDVNVDNSTIVKSGNSLAVGTVPAASVSVADSGDVFTGTNVEAVLAELAGEIDAATGGAKSYKIVEVQNPASQNTLHEYKIQEKTANGSWGDVTGSDNIIVPKDKSLDRVELVSSKPDPDHQGETISGQFLKFTYNLADGSQSDVYVDVSAFLTENEFGDGLSLSDAGVVSVNAGNGLGINSTTKAVEVVIDSTSEAFLTVGADGVKLDGVQDAIDAAQAAAVANLDLNDAAVTGQYVSQVTQTDGQIAVSRVAVSAAPLNNYTKGSDATAVAASDTINEAISKLENQVDAAKSATTTAIQALDVSDTAVDGKVVTAVSETDGIVSSTKADLAGVKLGGFTQDASATGEIAAGDTLSAALNKLENGIDAAKQAATAGHSAVAKDTNASHLTLSEATDTTTGKKTYTIGENDIASASDLTAEVTRAKQAEAAIDAAVGLTKAADPSETRSFTATTNYGTGSTTVMGNMQALDTQLKTVSDNLAAIQYKVVGTELTFYGMTEHS